MLKAVVFDVDGTLGDTIDLCVEAFRVCTEEITGRRPEYGEVTRFFGVSDRGVLGGLLGMSPEDPALPIGRLVEIYEELHPALAPAPFPGVREMLTALRATGLRLALITGKEHYTAEPTLRAFGLNGLFEWQGLGDPRTNIKAERLTELMQLWHMAPEELIYVGDAPADIELSHRVGVRIINAAWATSAAELAADCLALNPDYRLDDIHALLPLILSL